MSPLAGAGSSWRINVGSRVGAADDLAKVTEIARAIVTRYGMTEALGHVALVRDRMSYLTPNEMAAMPNERDYSESTAAAVDEEVRSIIDHAFERTVRALAEKAGHRRAA